MVSGARDELVDHVLRYLASLTSADIGPDDDCFAAGLVSSLRVLELVTYVERTFGVPIDVCDLDLDNFRTAARIAAFVRRKRALPATVATTTTATE